MQLQFIKLMLSQASSQSYTYLSIKFLIIKHFAKWSFLLLHVYGGLYLLLVFISDRRSSTITAPARPSFISGPPFIEKALPIQSWVFLFLKIVPIISTSEISQLSQCLLLNHSVYLKTFLLFIISDVTPCRSFIYFPAA